MERQFYLYINAKVFYKRYRACIHDLVDMENHIIGGKGYCIPPNRVNGEYAYLLTLDRSSDYAYRIGHNSES